VVKAAAGRALVRSRLGLGIRARRRGVGAVGGGDVGVAFYRFGAGARRPGDGGERAVAVVRHDGGGGGRFGRRSTGAVVGSGEGGVLRPFREHKRGGGRWCVRVHARRRWRRQQFGQGRKTIGRGLRVFERGRGELARPGKGQGPVAGGGGITMGGERGVGRPRWKERRAAAGPNPEPGQNSKRNSFRISIDFRIWQNFGKLYNEIYEEF
jgi:hypothetical protein